MDRIPYVPLPDPTTLPVLHDYDDGLAGMFAPAAESPADQADETV